MGQPSFVVTWDGDDKAVHEGARLGGEARSGHHPGRTARLERNRESL